MSAFLLALLAVPAANAIDVSRLATKETAVAFAQEIASKSTEEEHKILKTLLGERANWHPDATSLLDQVDKRDANHLRRLEAEQGRRLLGFGSEVAGRYYCDGSDQTECENMVDDQCNQCMWSGSRCDVPTCSDYKNETACCGNAMKLSHGCRWSQGYCTVNECERITNETTCNAAATCFYGCDATLGGRCMAGKASDYNCNCAEANGKCEPKEQVNLGQALNALGAALGSSGCNIMDCAKCVNGLGNSCKDKKTQASSNECKAQCGELTHCDAETECLFCGPKKGSCTPRVASTPTTCGDPPAPVANADQKCADRCTPAGTRCPSSCGGDFKCYEKKQDNTGGVQPIFATAGVFVAIVASMLQ